MKTTEELDELNKTVAALDVKFGMRRVLLHRADGFAEEVWAVLCDDLSSHRYASSSSYNEIITVRLLNRPFAWANKDWGDEIRARTNRHSRPYAHEFENKAEPIAAPTTISHGENWPYYDGY